MFAVLLAAAGAVLPAAPVLDQLFTYLVEDGVAVPSASRGPLFRGASCFRSISQGSPSASPSWLGAGTFPTCSGVNQLLQRPVPAWPLTSHAPHFFGLPWYCSTICPGQDLPPVQGGRAASKAVPSRGPL